MPTILITGANRGIGLEFARQYSADGWRVIAPSAATLTMRMPLQNYRSRRNPSTWPPSSPSRPLPPLCRDSRSISCSTTPACTKWRIATEALLDNLARAERPVVGNASSKMGSMANNTSGGVYIYRSVKAAPQCRQQKSGRGSAATEDYCRRPASGAGKDRHGRARCSDHHRRQRGRFAPRHCWLDARR